MKLSLYCIIACLGLILPVYADYERNKAVPVEKVLFGAVTSVRNITEHELVRDNKQGWKVFGGALLGGAIGNQFGSGSGRDVATILGAVLGASAANSQHKEYSETSLNLVELMIITEQNDEFMVIQDLDPLMRFNRDDKVRMVYLSNGMVRIDKQW